MKTSDLVERLVAHGGMDRKTARKAIEVMLAGIAEAVAKNEDVLLAGFGRFKVKDAPARQGRNPSTGEVIDIPASRKLAFVPAKALKDSITG